MLVHRLHVVNRKAGIHGAHFFADTLEERSRLTLRAYDERHLEALPLFQRIEKERRRIFSKRQIFPVLDDPDNFHHRSSGSKPKST